ncbi:GNAT family N-acetyltransferase [Phreatobacter stygius]|nr:GNAT family N-acetyltransferase [Phreatobacter stygius]
MPVVLRPYVEADRRFVVALVHQLNVFEDAISGDRAKDRSAAEACLDADLERAARDGGAVIVATDGAELVGMMAWVIDPPQPYLRADIGKVALVTELVVDERSRGQGIGTALLEEAERLSRLHQVSRLRIGAIAGNSIARRAYERFGFRTTYVELAKDLDEE